MDTFENFIHLFTDYGLEKAMTKYEDAQALAEQLNTFGRKYYFAGTQWENETHYTAEGIMKTFEKILTMYQTADRVDNAVKNAKNKTQNLLEALKKQRCKL